MPVAAIRPNVRDQLGRFERELAALRAAAAAQQRLIEQITVGAASGAANPGTQRPVWMTPGWAIKLTTFLERTGIPRRTFYYLKEQGKLRSIVMGDRSIYVLVNSYIDYVAALDREQNGPDAASRPPVNPPPVPRRRDRDIGSLTTALPTDTGPPSS